MANDKVDRKADLVQVAIDDTAIVTDMQVAAKATGREQRNHANHSDEQNANAQHATPTELAHNLVMCPA